MVWYCRQMYAKVVSQGRSFIRGHYEFSASCPSSPSSPRISAVMYKLENTRDLWDAVQARSTTNSVPTPSHYAGFGISSSAYMQVRLGNPTSDFPNCVSTGILLVENGETLGMKRIKVMIGKTGLEYKLAFKENKYRLSQSTMSSSCRTHESKCC